MKSSRHKRARGQHHAKKSALEELEQIKKTTKETKAQQPISLSSFPFPERAISALNDDKSTTEPSSIVRINTRKKKGKVFVLPVHIDLCHINL